MLRVLTDPKSLVYPSRVSRVYNSTFSSNLLASERGLTNKLTNQLIRYGSLAITLFFISQLYFASGSSSPIIYTIGVFVLILNLTSIILANRYDKNWIIFLSYTVLLITPIYIDSYIQKPWISYGFLVVVIVLTAAMMDNLVTAITILIFSLIWNYFIASIDLIGVSDKRDILLFGSYFSTVWLLIFGSGLIIARRSYYKYCDDIDEKLFEIEQSLYERNKIISRINLMDHRNIVLHGTVLNTLISYKNSFRDFFDIDSLSNQLSQDLAKIESTDITNRKSRDLRMLLVSNLKSYGLNLDIELAPRLANDTEIPETWLEIIREIILNIKKHTDSKEIKLTIDSDDESVLISVVEYFGVSVPVYNAEVRVQGVRNSITLERLIKYASAQFSVSAALTYDRLIYKIRIPNKVSNSEILSKISDLRRESLTRIVEAISIMSLIYSLFALFGFLFLDVSKSISFSILAIAFLMSSEIISSHKTQWRPVLLQFLALSLIPITFIGDISCSNLLFTPWLFNAIFGSVLFSIYFISNPILKWIPGLIFIVESVATRFIYPQECKNLLDGSTPGFILILLFSYSLGEVRNRNLSLDNEIENFLNSQSALSFHISKQIDAKRKALILELEKFVLNLRRNLFDKDQGFKAIEIWIQRLRAFLICSEYFHSDLVRDAYDFIDQRLSKDRKTKISIYAENIPDKCDFDFSSLRDLDQLSTNFEAELIITDSDQLVFEYYVDKKLIKSFAIYN